MADVFLSLGSNRGDPAALVEAAMAAMTASPGIRLRARSSLYRTAPVGPVAQDWFVNAAIRIETALSPDALLAACHTVERELGRKRDAEIRWGPRPIDIDIIAYDDLALEQPGLTLPHPRFSERAFVIVPIFEIAPDAVIGGMSIRDRYRNLDRTGVERMVPTSSD